MKSSRYRSKKWKSGGNPKQYRLVRGGDWSNRGEEGPFLETDREGRRDRLGIGASAHVSAIIGVSWDGHVIRFYRFYPRFELAARFAHGKRKGFAFEGFRLKIGQSARVAGVSRSRPLPHDFLCTVDEEWKNPLFRMLISWKIPSSFLSS